jgi:hypothetical protein
LVYSWVSSDFQAAVGPYRRTQVAMGLKGADPYFQNSMQNKVLHGLVCEIYIGDVLTHGKTDPELLISILYILYTVHTVHEVSPSTSVHSHVLN